MDFRFAGSSGLKRPARKQSFGGTNRSRGAFLATFSVNWPTSRIRPQSPHDRQRFNRGQKLPVGVLLPAAKSGMGATLDRLAHRRHFVKTKGESLRPAGQDHRHVAESARSDSGRHSYNGQRHDARFSRRARYSQIGDQLTGCAAKPDAHFGPDCEFIRQGTRGRSPVISDVHCVASPERVASTATLGGGLK